MNSTPASPGRDINSDNSVPGPVNSGQDCAVYLSGECPFGISGKTGGICRDNHPKRCMPYMRWGNKSDRGCSGIACGKAHPTLCPKSLDLKCFDNQCPWKLHTHRCMRAATGSGRGDQGRSDWARVGRQGWGDRGPRDNRFSAQGSSRGYSGGPRSGGGTRQAGDTRSSQWGPGRPQGGPGRPQGGAGLPWNIPCFQGVTAQQTKLGTLEQQLQQAVIRAILQALSRAVSGLGVGSVPPSF